MPLPASGQITLNQVNVELGNSGTAQISMNSSAVRGLFGIASGQLTMSQGYGKSARLGSPRYFPMRNTQYDPTGIHFSTNNPSYSFVPFDGIYTTSDVTNLRGIVANDNNYNDIDTSEWDTSTVTIMTKLFALTSFNRNIDSWDVSNVTAMNSMFAEAVYFNQNLSSWDVSNVTDMNRMFLEAEYFNQNLSSWDVSSVANMRMMFMSATSFNQPLNSWDVSSVTNMLATFADTLSFNQTLTSWDVSSVTKMYDMFADANSFNQNLSSWTPNVSQTPSSFSESTSNWTSKETKLPFLTDGTRFRFGKGY